MPDPIYSSNLPCPRIDGYALSVDSGLVRTSFDSGHTRQRRRFSNQPTTINLEFSMSVTDLYDWQKWANEWGYEWFTMALKTKWSAVFDGDAVMHRIKFVSNLAVRALSPDWVSVSVTAIVDVNYVPSPGLPVFTGDWVIAGEPPAPSADWVIAGEAPGPNEPDEVIAGNPSNPASNV